MPRRKALLIGINYIGSQNELAGCINDVENGQLYSLYLRPSTHAVTAVRRYLIHDKGFPHDPTR
jgi:hypothetical protein